MYLNSMNIQCLVNLDCRLKIQNKGQIHASDDNLIPVESDVNQFLSKRRALLDTEIADLNKNLSLLHN